MITTLLSCTLIIWLFGGYVDSIDQTAKPLRKLMDQAKRQEVKTLNTIVKHERDFSTWFVVLSPALGVLFGFLSLLIFAR